ncbi:hypothetical protein Godav_021563 [Gossypium davidsonii]|uniref:Uncharacterized protein n=2 Tax=Gossypium TaxID=3633 RepID=A0A7J8R6U7_GOSDV|nr:hypothetical protein [Gossypium davidsonii]MBA0644560.1 hypothetical protein [Gossypium klotzschianum]
MQTGSSYFFTRRSSRGVVSCEDYHEGATVAIPFNWESEPGTPKVKSCEIPRLPPLTPPPSYFYATPKRTSVKQHSKPKLLNTIFPKRLRRKPRVQLSPAASSSSSSSSASSSRSSSPWPRAYSVPSSPISASNLYAGNELPRGELFSGSRAADKEDHEYEYSVSTPCFGCGGGTGPMSRGFCSTMLKALLRNR